MISSESSQKIKDILHIEESIETHAVPYKGEKCITWILPTGKLHRKYGPARVFYHANGSIKQEEFWIYGKLHREDGPAWVNYYKMREEYHLDGNLLIFSEWEREMAKRNLAD